MVDLDENTIITQFLEIKPSLVEWGKKVDTILKNFLDSLGYSAERIQRGPESRVKDLDSFRRKALYRGKNYEDPIKEVTDKVGTRVVLLNIADVGVVSDFINGCDKWEVIDQSQDIDYIRSFKPNEFGYQSNHFIVRPKEPLYPEEQRELLTCEIQVRTLLQHAYAETSHDTVYKSGHKEDPQVLRGLAITMAFLETADEKIKFIYDKSKAVQTTRSLLLAEIIDLYRSFVPEYKERVIDAGLTDAFMSIFDDDFFKTALSKIRTFTEEKRGMIGIALKKRPAPVLFQQPISILAFFAIYNNQRRLINNWPFTQGSLRDVISAMGFSEDIL